jgi:hypothetical protein
LQHVVGLFISISSEESFHFLPSCFGRDWRKKRKEESGHPEIYKE